MVLRVDLERLEENVRIIRKRLPNRVRFAFVVKANAYGHGLIPCSKRVENLVHCFCVATAQEAFLLRQVCPQKPLLLLGRVFPRELPKLLKNGVILTLSDVESVKLIKQAAAESSGLPINVHLKFDVGMHRFGFSSERLLAWAFDELQAVKNVSIRGVYSHFPCAGNEGMRIAQLKCFISAIGPILSKKINLIRHIAASESLFDARCAFDMVRCGIAAFGYAKECKLSLKPVLSMFAPIVQIKRIEKGEYIGYGKGFVADKVLKIAVVRCGYGDGYLRSLSNKGFVFLRGKRCSIVGNICMDALFIDVSNVSDVLVGDFVELIGDHCPADELAALAKTVPHEILTQPNGRTPFVMV